MDINKEWRDLRATLSHGAVIPQSRLRPVWDLGDQLIQTLDEVKTWYESEQKHGGDNPWWYNKKLNDLKEILGIDDT